jgi:hypothetical protein
MLRKDLEKYVGVFFGLLVECRNHGCYTKRRSWYSGVVFKNTESSKSASAQQRCIVAVVTGSSNATSTTDR